MAGFNTLNSMGLTDISSISHHILTTTAAQDVLKIYFKTTDQAVLPQSVSFNFERDDPKNEQAAVLTAALSELATVESTQGRAQHKQRLLNELDHLEQVMAAKLQEMRADLTQF
ncbi:MAG: DUF3461 family protein [Gammaproteobacteria bacterium]|nr:DUF3461 family protein [Gammaproteobacteria bacterium]